MSRAMSGDPPARESAIHQAGSEPKKNESLIGALIYSSLAHLAVLVFAVTAFFSRVPTSVEDVKKKLFKAMAVADVPLVDKTVSEILPHPADAAFVAEGQPW